jgi:nitric oxide reductase subunit C
MSLRLAKVVFWGGTLSSLALFLVLTWDTHSSFASLTHADKLDAHVVAGKHAFERYNCNDCHTILGFGGYYAPDLTRVVSRLGEDAVRRRVKQPEVAFATSYRKMPQQHLAAQEIEDLVAFLRWTGEIDNHDWPPQDSPNRWKRSTERLLAQAALSPAAALIQQEGCLACHALGDAGERRGPRLERIGLDHDAVWVADYLASPIRMAPGSEMPSFEHLSVGQRRMLADFIVGLAHADAR